jgi:hypothetical protein
MAKSVEVRIALDDLEFLKTSQYLLCFAKAVNNTYNVVWQAFGDYLHVNPFGWIPLYQLFGTNTVSNGGVVVVQNTNPVTIGLGEQAALDANGNLGPAVTGGPAASITLINQYGPIHPGLSGVSTGPDGVQRTTPIFVAPLAITFGTDVLTPVDRVQIWFQQNAVQGAMIGGSVSNAIEVDLTTADSASVQYQRGVWSKA